MSPNHLNQIWATKLSHNNTFWWSFWWSHLWIAAAGSAGHPPRPRSSEIKLKTGQLPGNHGCVFAEPAAVHQRCHRLFASLQEDCTSSRVICLRRKSSYLLAKIMPENYDDYVQFDTISTVTPKVHVRRGNRLLRCEMKTFIFIAHTKYQLIWV